MGMVSAFLFWGALDSAFLADFKGGPIFLEPAEPEPSEPDFETEPLEPEPDDFETVRNRTEPELPVIRLMLRLLSREKTIQVDLHLGDVRKSDAWQTHFYIIEQALRGSYAGWS